MPCLQRRDGKTEGEDKEPIRTAETTTKQIGPNPRQSRNQKYDPESWVTIQGIKKIQVKKSTMIRCLQINLNASRAAPDALELMIRQEEIDLCI